MRGKRQTCVHNQLLWAIRSSMPVECCPSPTLDHSTRTLAVSPCPALALPIDFDEFAEAIVQLIVNSAENVNSVCQSMMGQREDSGVQ